MITVIAILAVAVLCGLATKKILSTRDGFWLGFFLGVLGVGIAFIMRATGKHKDFSMSRRVEREMPWAAQGSDPPAPGS